MTFTNIHDQGLLGVVKCLLKEGNASKVINLIDQINRNALPVDVGLSESLRSSS